ncbi:MAG: DUF4282 domain-containing protein [Kiritimatiellae bacterium]|nr:DUF4282 domain-containing protein [Kiritimatiellia bacterium]
MEQKGLLGTIFDLSFSEFITIKVMKFVFVLLILFASLTVLFVIVTGFTQGALAGIAALILSPLLFFLYVLGARIWCELTIVLFRIAGNTDRLVKHSEGTK